MFERPCPSAFEAFRKLFERHTCRKGGDSNINQQQLDYVIYLKSKICQSEQATILGNVLKTAQFPSKSGFFVHSIIYLRVGLSPPQFSVKISLILS